MKILARPLSREHHDYRRGCRWELCILDVQADDKLVATHRWTLNDRAQAEREVRRFAGNAQCPGVLIDEHGREIVLT